MNSEDDALLVAFLDKALDPAAGERLGARLAGDAELRARLEALDAGGLAFQPAFAALLDAAPLDRLRASLDVAEASGRRSRTIGEWVNLATRAVIASVAIVLFLAGFLVGRFAPVWPLAQQEQPDRDDWLRAVARYMSLYTVDTFALSPADPTVQSAELGAVGAKVGAPLTPERVAVADLTFKRAEILSYDNAPVAELAYLDPISGPALFCIIADARPDAPISRSTMQGFATASWAHGGRGFIVIGRLAPQKVAEIAGDLAGRF